MTNIKTATVFLCVSLCLLSCPEDARSDGVPAIKGTLTPIKSSIEGIISNRHQEHMWMTEDGGVCVVTAGSKSSGTGLYFSCTYDQGGSWKQIYKIRETAARPKADILFQDDTLGLVYQGADLELMYQSLAYSTGSRKWTPRESIEIYDSPDYVADKATLAGDARGRKWVAMKETNRTSENSRLRVGYFDAGGRLVMLDKAFGTDNKSTRKSARISTSSKGVGIVYTDGPDERSSAYTLNWAYHLDEWPLEKWVETELYRFSVTDGEHDADGVHYSATVDGQDNVHVVTTADGDALYYFKISGYDGIPAGPMPLGNSKEYVKISASSVDDIYVTRTFNSDGRYQIIGLLQSSDNGRSFSEKSYLYYKKDRNLGNPRLEMPSHVDSVIPILRQIDIPSNLFGLVYFQDQVDP